MTNLEKAWEIAKAETDRFGVDYFNDFTTEDLVDAAMQMAEWKDNEFALSSTEETIRQWLNNHADTEDNQWVIYDEHAAVASTIRETEEVSSLYEVEVPCNIGHYFTSNTFYTKSLKDLITFLKLCKIKI